MRHFLVAAVAAGALALGTAGAMAQQPAPVPNASGSQVTNPQTYGATANQKQAAQPKKMAQHPAKRMAKHPVKRRHVAQRHHTVRSTGSVQSHRIQRVPVPNASGSQVTDPNTYRATAYQHRRR